MSGKYDDLSKAQLIELLEKRDRTKKLGLVWEQDEIALVEIKDDGETGRLQSDRNIDKIRVQHREYRNVFWTYRDNGDWVRARYAEGLHRIVPKDILSVSEMVFLE